MIHPCRPPCCGLAAGRHSRRGRRSGGVALIVVVTLCALLSVIVLAAHREARRRLAQVDAMSQRRQAQWLAWGGIRLAAALLEADPTPGFDHAAEPWAQPFPEQALGPGTLLIRVEDLQARLDLNNLGGTPPDPARRWADVVEDLLRISRVRPGGGALSALTDWIDEDPAGASESALYLRRDPPHRAKDGRLDSLSELRLVAGWPDSFWEGSPATAGGLASEAPAGLVVAIPRRGGAGGWTTVNLNTAPLPVLWAVLGYSHQGSAEAIARVRAAVPFTQTGLAEILIPPEVVDSVRPWIDVRSDFFRVHVRSRVAGQEVDWEADLSRADAGVLLASRLVTEGRAVDPMPASTRRPDRAQTTP